MNLSNIGSTEHIKLVFHLNDKDFNELLDSRFERQLLFESQKIVTNLIDSKLYGEPF